MGGLIGGVILGGAEPCGEGESYCGLGGVLVGGVLGIAVGTPFGIYKMGNAAHHDGDYLPTLLGSVMGLFSTIAIFNNTEVGNSVAGTLGVLTGVPIVGGLLMYRVSDRMAFRLAPEPGTPPAERKAFSSGSPKDFRTDIQVVLLRL